MAIAPRIVGSPQPAVAAPCGATSKWKARLRPEGRIAGGKILRWERWRKWLVVGTAAAMPEGVQGAAESVRITATLSCAGDACHTGRTVPGANTAGPVAEPAYSILNSISVASA